MNQVNCPICGRKCVKSGKTKAGTQRWMCKKCGTSQTHKIDNDSKELKIFLDWLFGKDAQTTMPGEGRTFRRKTAKFWDRHSKIGTAILQGFPSPGGLIFICSKVDMRGIINYLICAIWFQRRVADVKE